MNRPRLLQFLLIGIVLLGPASLYAQRERQIQAPEENGEFGTKFFDQLRSIFGKFRDSDLQRVFQLANPIQCTELVSGKGEWRPVAFFNEKRELGDWYRSSIEEVRADLSVYIFKGVCRGDHGAIQLTTKFPVGESLDAYNAGKIAFEQIDVNVNAPVNAAYDTRSGAYMFDLPYLYLVNRQGINSTYSLIPPRFGDRYASDVTNNWDCKAASSIDITYRFLICRTSTADRNPAPRNQTRSTPSFGSTAYFILSDGSEAHSSVTLNFGDPDHPDAPPVPEVHADASPDKGVTGWQAPTYKSQIVDVGMAEFRIRFTPQSWTDRIGASQVLSNQKMAGLQSAKPPEGADYCVWSPGTGELVKRLMSEEPDADVSYSVQGINRGNGQSTASVVFTMKTHTGTRLGTLQCFFQRADTTDDIGYDRWAAIVGGQLKLEIRTQDSPTNKN